MKDKGLIVPAIIMCVVILVLDFFEVFDTGGWRDYVGGLVYLIGSIISIWLLFKGEFRWIYVICLLLTGIFILSGVIDEDYFFWKGLCRVISDAGMFVIFLLFLYSFNR